MTKPITSVAAMMLWEEGRFELKDPVARFLPEFAEPRVFARRRDGEGRRRCRRSSRSGCGTC